MIWSIKYTETNQVPGTDNDRLKTKHWHDVRLGKKPYSCTSDSMNLASMISPPSIMTIAHISQRLDHSWLFVKVNNHKQEVIRWFSVKIV